MNIEGLNYNVHMQSRTYCSLEVALVHKLVYDFYCKYMYYAQVLSIYLSCEIVTVGATNKNYLQ